MATFYLGLSMAGTVSAGTFTGGTLVELNDWLLNFQKAKENGLTLKAIKDVGTIKKGDYINFTKEEIPQHDVKIKVLTGASGGGVSAALFLFGLTQGNLEQYLRDVWTDFDVKEMLDTDDLTTNKIFSLLNVKPLNNMAEKLRNDKWANENHAKNLSYLDDEIEVLLTLASLEGIPFNTVPRNSGKTSYGVHKTHLDYIRFKFSKHDVITNKYPEPYAYNLLFRPNFKFKDDNNWAKLIDSCLATAAFPFGFKPRTINRFRKEYNGKLFYLNYSNPSNKTDFSKLSPAWLPGNDDDDFDMEYVDGGTFNREPHDLGRAALLRSLDKQSTGIDNEGIKTDAAIILIDPFPSNTDNMLKPGEKITEIPDIFGLVGNITEALMNQGRFRPDWIEKALNEKYYSRYLISPTRKDSNETVQKPSLAGEPLGAFAGFIDKKFREHDYRLGHYNTYGFLGFSFMLPIENEVVNYCQIKDKLLLLKYEAVGWYDAQSKHCQIIPRCIEPNIINSLQKPVWPSISQADWSELESMAMDRAKEILYTLIDLNVLTDGIIQKSAWTFKVKGKVQEALDKIKTKMKNDYKLLR